MTILDNSARDRLEQAGNRFAGYLDQKLTEARFNALTDYKDQLVGIAGQYAMQRGSDVVTAEDLANAQRTVFESASVQIRRT